MNAVIADNAVIGESSIVAACAFVRRRAWRSPPAASPPGMPAKVVRELSAGNELEDRGPCTYQDLAERSLATCTAAIRLTEVEPDHQAHRDRRRSAAEDVKKSG